MRNIIKTEFLKLKRYSVIKAGIIMTTLSPLLSTCFIPQPTVDRHGHLTILCNRL